jgi:hypothetical protein
LKGELQISACEAGACIYQLDDTFRKLSIKAIRTKQTQFHDIAIKRRARAVNEMHDEMQILWPEGIAVDFCIALALDLLQIHT